MLKALVSEQPFASVTVTRSVKTPSVVGMPLSSAVDELKVKGVPECSKRLNFSEDALQHTPDTLSYNSLKTQDPKESLKEIDKDRLATRNSFEISDAQLKDLEIAFGDQFD